MTSTTIAELLEDLGVTRSLSRPRTSNDNPFIEAHFKTAKYRPDYRLFGVQRGVTVSSRSQLGVPA